MIQQYRSIAIKWDKNVLSEDYISQILLFHVPLDIKRDLCVST